MNEATPRPTKSDGPTAELFETYERLGSIEARPWTAADAEAYALSNVFERKVSVSSADVPAAMKANPPSGMVARNPANHADQWYIAAEYFAKHYRRPSPAQPDDAAAIRSYYFTVYAKGFQATAPLWHELADETKQTYRDYVARISEPDVGRE